MSALSKKSVLKAFYSIKLSLSVDFFLKMLNFPSFVCELDQGMKFSLMFMSFETKVLYISLSFAPSKLPWIWSSFKLQFCFEWGLKPSLLFLDQIFFWNFIALDSTMLFLLNTRTFSVEIDFLSLSFGFNLNFEELQF